MSRVVVTGANGFVGRHVCARLASEGHAVLPVTRRPDPALAVHGEVRVLDDFTDAKRWRAVLHSADSVVHLIARTHRGEATDARTAAAFHAINVDITRTLMRAVRGSEVGRIVFVSSAKVCGERSARDVTGACRPLCGTDVPRPEGAYGRSKLAAEHLLHDGCAAAGITLTILRPPLVYGVGMRGNLLALLRAVDRGWPLPFASIDNRRSLVAVEHLATAIGCALRTRGPRATAYTLADSALSTPDLVRQMAAALGRPARLWRCPVSVLRALGVLTGRQAAIARLTDSMVVDSTAITRDLGWTPGLPLEATWRAIADWYRALR